MKYSCASKNLKEKFNTNDKRVYIYYMISDINVIYIPEHTVFIVCFRRRQVNIIYKNVILY